MTRQESNRQIVLIFSALIEHYPDMRFGQLMDFAGMVLAGKSSDGQMWKDEFYLESDQLLQRIKVTMRAQAQAEPTGGPVMTRDHLRVGMFLSSPVTSETYEVTALGRRYVLVEVRTQFSSHEFTRRYEELEGYVEISAAQVYEKPTISPASFTLHCPRDARKIEAVKTIRYALGVDLKQAVRMVQNGESFTFDSTWSPHQRDKLMEDLRALGVTVTVVRFSGPWV